MKGFVRFVICVVCAVAFSWALSWGFGKLGILDFGIKPLFTLFGFGINLLLMASIASGFYVWHRTK